MTTSGDQEPFGAVSFPGGSTRLRPLQDGRDGRRVVASNIAGMAIIAWVVGPC